MGDDFDLRAFTQDEDEFVPYGDEDEDLFDSARDVDELSTPFLGMSPMERMFLSIFLFMNVAILGVAVLMATNRI